MPEGKWKASHTEELVCGAASSIVARFVIAPLDVIKIRLQVQGSPSARSIQYKNMRECVGTMLQKEGIRSFWKGNLSAELMVAPYGALSFWSHQTFKRLLFHHDNPHGHPTSTPVMSFTCGALAGATATIGTYPLDLFRTRLAVQSNKEKYFSLSHAVRVVVKEDGLTGLYRGCWPTLLGVVPYMATQFAVYESLVAALFQEKRAMGKIPKDGGGQGHITDTETAAIGFLAGVISKLLTLPCDVVKKRIQVDGFDSRGPRSTGLLEPFQMAARIVRHEGVRGLYSGCLPSLAKAGPNSATIFYTYRWCIEACRAWDSRHS